MFIPHSRYCLALCCGANTHSRDIEGGTSWLGERWLSIWNTRWMISLKKKKNCRFISWIRVGNDAEKWRPKLEMWFGRVNRSRSIRFSTASSSRLPVVIGTLAHPVEIQALHSHSEIQKLYFHSCFF